MAKPNQAQEQTMEEILASIRRIISDDEARSAARPTPTPREPPRPASNVSHLFAEPSPPEPAFNVVELPLENIGGEEPALITEAFAAAMEAPDEPEDMHEPPPPAPPRPRLAPTPMQAVVERPPAPPLLSPQTDAAVTSAFDQLTESLFGKSRTIDALVEDMLRPMLKSWLDNNLPPLVERMVREEIDRVSRGRR